MYQTYAWICMAFVGAVFAEKLIVPEHLRGPAAILQHTCQVESGLSEESMAMARRGILPDDRAFRCHLDCMLDKVGLYDDAHNIDPSIIWHIVPEWYKAKISVVMEACKTIHGNDRCDTAYLTLKCYLENDSDVDVTEWFVHTTSKK